MVAIRPWCAKARYPGLKDFYLGTVILPKDARHDEILEALYEYGLSFLPPGFEIINPVCGAIFFQET